jgi:hypothetical protein
MEVKLLGEHEEESS